MKFINNFILILPLLVLQSCSITDQVPNTNAENNGSNQEVINENADLTEIGKSIIALSDIEDSKIIEETGSLSNANVVDDLDAKPEVSPKLEQTKYEQFLSEQALLKAGLPENINNLYMLAISTLKNKQFKDANKLFDEVITLNPNLTGAYLNKGLVLYQLKQNDDALKTLNTALKININNPYVHNLKAIILREQGQFVDAETHYKEALSIWPNYPNAHLNLAVLYELYRGDFGSAKSHYQTYLALQPNNDKVKQWLAGLEIKIAIKDRG